MSVTNVTELTKDNVALATLILCYGEVSKTGVVFRTDVTNHNIGPLPPLEFNIENVIKDHLLAVDLSLFKDDIRHPRAGTILFPENMIHIPL